MCHEMAPYTPSRTRLTIFSAAKPPLRPIYGTYEINGEPVIAFDGARLPNGSIILTKARACVIQESGYTYTLAEPRSVLWPR